MPINSTVDYLFWIRDRFDRRPRLSCDKCYARLQSIAYPRSPRRRLTTPSRTTQDGRTARGRDRTFLFGDSDVFPTYRRSFFVKRIGRIMRIDWDINIYNAFDNIVFIMNGLREAIIIRGNRIIILNRQ